MTGLGKPDSFTTGAGSNFLTFERLRDLLPGEAEDILQSVL